MRHLAFEQFSAFYDPCRSDTASLGESDQLPAKSRPSSGHVLFGRCCRHWLRILRRSPALAIAPRMSTDTNNIARSQARNVRPRAGAPGPRPSNNGHDTFFSPGAHASASSSSLTSMTAWKTCLRRRGQSVKPGMAAGDYMGPMADRRGGRPTFWSESAAESSDSAWAKQHSGIIILPPASSPP